MRRISFSIVFIFIRIISFGQVEIVFSGEDKLLPIGRSVEFLIDENSSLDFSAISSSEFSDKFEKANTPTPNFLLPRSTIWGKFTIRNQSTETCYFFIEHPRIHHLEFYQKNESGKYESKSVGYFQPLNKRDFLKSSFVFELPVNEDLSTYYFKINSEEQVILPMHVTSIRGLINKWQSKNVFLGIYLGIIFISIFANLQFYLSTRERFYLHHLLRVIALVVVIDIGTNGLLFKYVFPGTPIINKSLGIFFGLAIIAEANFCRSFLKTKILIPAQDKLMMGIIFLGVISIALNLFASYYISFLFISIGGIITTVSLIYTGVVSYSKKYKPAIYFVLGTGCYSLSAFLYVLMINDIIPQGANFHIMLSLGLMLETIVTTIGLAYLVKLLREEKEKAQASVIEVINTYNEELEKEIYERTKEIASQNEEIQAQNEELVVTQEVISTQNIELERKNKKLEEAKKTIEDKNRLLQLQARNLETEIVDRLSDVRRINEELIQHNHQLEQFSYITAHNLRSPVARLLGLTNLLSLQKLNKIDIDEVDIKDKIAQTGRDLDEVIHDITAMLEIKKGSIKNFELVELDQKIAHIQLLMKDDILESNATFICDFTKAPSLQSLPAYIESIFYNLISNSIKYKSYHRNPVITIKSFLENNKVRIVYRDNGIGLDLNQFREKIFGLYQRFNHTVEGKGLGLHLVKTQVEALGGTIAVHSEPGDGIQFTIVMPIAEEIKENKKAE